MGHGFAKGVEIGGHLTSKLEIGQLLREHHVRNASRENGIGTRSYWDVLIAVFGGLGSPRIDADNTGAVEPARFLHEVPLVMTGR